MVCRYGDQRRTEANREQPTVGSAPDFHNHSSPSGDNTSSQFGRVLNLLCEHIEYAPCTEHNRVTTYAPHLERLKASHLMGTCTGIEMTGSPLPLNHQNAFPMVFTPRTQDGGGPLSDVSPEAQIARLALWDNRSEKLVQQNHPDLGRLFFDKDGDGKPDGGFAASLPFMDVIEVHPLQTIFEPALVEVRGKPENNRVLNWLQLLNQGYRIPGTVCTDAHYNFHGSGFLRIYLQSSTDHPADVKTLDVVHAAEKGHIVMTNGPFLEVSRPSLRRGAWQTGHLGRRARRHFGQGAIAGTRAMSQLVRHQSGASRRERSHAERIEFYPREPS